MVGATVRPMRGCRALAVLVAGALTLAALLPPPAADASGNAFTPATVFDGAKWIWWSVPKELGLGQFPAGVYYFRAQVTVPEQSLVEKAELVVTADNLYSVWINGKRAADGHADPNAWNRPLRFDVAGLLLPGQNIIAVEAINTVPGPAGLLLKLWAQLVDGQTVSLASDAAWKASDREEPNWQQMSYDDNVWRPVRVVADYGDRPWGKIQPRDVVERAGLVNVSNPAVRQRWDQQKAAARLRARQSPAPVAASTPVTVVPPPADYAWPAAVLYLSDDCTLYRPLQHTGTAADSLSVTVFTTRKSRAYPEHDLPSPIKMGRKLCLLAPARPGVEPRVLLDAGRGAIGTPRVSFDGRWIYVAQARDGDAFFHIYRLPSGGGPAEQLTDGPFHDIDPVELPDGRLAFVSTRIGMFDEYHNPPARALFVKDADSDRIRPLTNTFVFDNEPQVLADGRILFIRSDNFFDRGKVETLLHAIRPDGTGGYTEFGLDNGPEYGGRLRAFYCGSPAPLPDGRVAFVSAPGITVGRMGTPARNWRNLSVEAGDVAALPDGRLLCSVGRRVDVEIKQGGQTRTVGDYSYQTLALLPPDADQMVMLHESAQALHSPIYLGPRPRPQQLAPVIEPAHAERPGATGILYCQNARLTKNTTAGWPHVRAVRVLAGKGLTLRSSHSYIVHAGSEVVELGTVPLAPDGSFQVEVPADMAIAFQAVDGEGRAELNEMSWIYVRPGERRGCVGCHHTRQDAPPAARSMPQAFAWKPVKLLGQGTPHRFRGNNPAVTGLMEMQFDRYRETAGLNRHAATRDPQATAGDEAAALAKLLATGDGGQRISAAGRLSIFRQRSTAGALAGALRDSDREVRLAAALSLGACGTRASLAPLVETLADDDPLVAQAAVVAIENLIGAAPALDIEAPQAIRRDLSGRWWNEQQRPGWEAIERGLIARLAGDDRDLQRRAAVALGHVGGRAAAEALRAYVLAHRDENPYPQYRKDHHYRGDNAKFNALSPLNPRPLQAAVRALGYLGDPAAVPLLAETVARNRDPEQSNLFLAEAALEALGRIGGAAAETALAGTLVEMQDYFHYVGWYGDHPALFACHASPLHYFATEALDRLGSTAPRQLVPALIRSLPTDVDRALFAPSDDCEALVGRVIRRLGAEAPVVETCLALLGDPQARATPEIEAAVSTTYQAWGGKPDAANRAAQVLASTCRDQTYEPRIRAAFERYRALPPSDIPRVFDTGIPIVQKLPVKNWVCFFLARALGNLADERSCDALLAALEQSPHEALAGRPDPTGPGVLFLHNDLTPCWRAAVAWALGRIGQRRAAPVLLKIVSDLDNAIDTRYAAAEALGAIGDPASLPALRQLAADYPEVSTGRMLKAACAAIASQGSGGKKTASAERGLY